MTNISNHISYKEATRSNTATKNGIDNTPDKEQLKNMQLLANSVFEPLRNFVGKPIFIPSFFRSEQLNVIIGGAKSSQHCARRGAAMDIDADTFGGVTNKQIFEYIRDNLVFDQLIWEFGTDDNPAWVHVSFNEGKNRLEILKAYKSNGLTKYERL